MQNLRADAHIELKVNLIHINGNFICGSILEQYKKKLIISLKHSNINPKVDPRYRGIMVGTGGKILLFGNTKQAGWVKLDQTAMPGNMVIKVQNTSIIRQENIKIQAIQTSLKPAPVTNLDKRWRVGDTIVIGPTSFNSSEAEQCYFRRSEPGSPKRWPYYGSPWWLCIYALGFWSMEHSVCC